MRKVRVLAEQMSVPSSSVVDQLFGRGVSPLASSRVVLDTWYLTMSGKVVPIERITRFQALRWRR